MSVNLPKLWPSYARKCLTWGTADKYIECGGNRTQIQFFDDIRRVNFNDVPRPAVTGVATMKIEAV